MTGAQILVESLVEQGVDTIFGYPGGTILNVYNVLYDYQDKITHYLTAHEQGAAHAADGYARASGKVGVCFATSGPGATNLVTGLATAYMDSIPVVAITCNVAQNLLGKDSFQEVDIVGITMPITKHNYIVDDASKLSEVIKEAFFIAKDGRPGPVLIDVLKNVTAEDVPYIPATEVEYKGLDTTISASSIEEAIKIIEGSTRPFIVSGGGVIASGANEILDKFVQKLNCPIATTLMGIGSYNKLPNYTGMVGMHGTKASNMGVTKSDLLIAIGARFSDRVVSNVDKFARHSKILHIDIDEAEIRKNVRVNCEVIGDAKEVLEILCNRISDKTDNAWLEEISALRNDFPVMDGEDKPLNPEYILRTISKKAPTSVITTEVGQHQMWTAQFVDRGEPRTFITSGGLGTMGFGTGASIGACVARPDRQVIAVAGDGSFRMNCNELATISYYNLPIIIVIVNNGTLGMVRQWQTLFYSKRYSSTTLDRAPNFKKLAEAYDIDGYEVTTKEEFDNAISTALEKQEPAIIDARIHIDEKVLPMVAPGQAIQKLILKTDD